MTAAPATYRICAGTLEVQTASRRAWLASLVIEVAADGFTTITVATEPLFALPRLLDALTALGVGSGDIEARS